MQESLSDLIAQLYVLVQKLEALTGRPFTPDGHMVGSIGEVLVRDTYNLELNPPSTKGHDASDLNSRNIEIKATQGNRGVAFRSCPDFAIVIRLEKDGTFELVYNGPGRLVWDGKNLDDKKMPSNGQHVVSLKDLRRLNKTPEAQASRAVLETKQG